MSLIKAVEGVCARLATDDGWHALLLKHGLDIKAQSLAGELNKTLAIDRTVKGFEDFSSLGQRGIEAAKPSHSLFYHALASPNVITAPNGQKLTLYPSAADIEAVLNYVYGVSPPSLADLQQQAGEGTPLALVVFATEYRPRPDTVHRTQADLCFSRTGIARVGTAPARYDPARRGFLPWMADDPQAICVTPARYSPYIAMQKKGDEGSFGPLSFQDGDGARNFWVPLQKLFEGAECIAGLELAVDMECFHINEKLRQFHLKFPNAGWHEPDISRPPFVMTDDLVEWANEQECGKGLIRPIHKARLVEEAIYEGENVFFHVPPNPSFGGYIINRRYKRREDGTVQDLNLEPNVVEIVKAGDYHALHFIDFTAEGWVRATCPQLEATGMGNAVAYSLVAAPDFYPLYTQRQLLEWTDRQDLPERLYAQTLKVLSDRRLAGNPGLEGGHFQLEDNGITAIVSHQVDGLEQVIAADVASAQRQTWLSDAAAATFSPGWEISTENGFTPKSLCAYELGSPFTEDVRICASQGGYWPAVSPDNSKTFEPKLDWIPIIPLTDDETGKWDGVNGPRLIDAANGKQVVEYINYEFTDYTKNALAGLLSVYPLAQTTAEDYQARILSMHHAFKALGAIERDEKSAWSVLSFMTITRPNAELEQAESETGTSLHVPVHFYRIYKNNRATTTTPPDDFTKRHAEIVEMVDLFASPAWLLIKREQDAWKAVEIE
ncbi:hypothetical protein [Pseudomonas sp. NFX15]|uniref:hypothetical protein n=1 Tax=Pseudomonas sp. NFX15 TaxID=2816958 RepID=UPI003B8C7317